MKHTNIKNVDKKRYSFFLVCLGVVFLLFIFRLIDWQIINAEYYKARANSSNTYCVNTDPVRGEILDCDGISLAVNDTGYKVIIDRLVIEQGKENELILETVKLLESLENSWIDILPIKLEDNSFIYMDDKESQIKVLKKTLELSEQSSAQECITKMISKYRIPDTYSNEDIRILCSIKYNMDRKAGYYSKSTPYILADDINKDSVVILLEKSEYLKGIRIQSSLTRKYVNGEIAPHIIGYTGFMSSEEYEKRKETYSMDAVIGKTGIEGAFEEFLRGHGGKRMIQMSKDGKIMNISDKEPATAGNTIFLTLSSKIQEIANESLKRNIQQSKNSGAWDCESGAVVALNVNDFSIIAAATYPNFDLAKFMEDKSYYSELATDKRVPLLNRAFSGAYAPGSIYKPLVACAALQEGLVTPDEPIYCGGSFNYYKGYRLGCMGVHGAAKLVLALARSCNVYFAELGRRLGAELLGTWAKKFGIGIKTGVEIGESSGVLAGPKHSEDVGSKWYESGSSQAAIGQSDNMFTPLQLATYVATIANGGNRYKTHLVKKITDYSRNEVIKEFGAELIENVGISEENLRAVKEGMREVVKSGTARDFANYPIEVAAKTGTAQNSGSDHTTFICFAPYEKPEIAIAVVIAHGRSGMTSKNVARDIMNEYFHIDK